MSIFRGTLALSALNNRNVGALDNVRREFRIKLVKLEVWFCSYLLPVM